MELTRVTVALKALGKKNEYQASFLVDTGSTNCLVAAPELRKIGITPVGKATYSKADGSLQEYAFGLAEISFMGEITAGRILFGPDGGRTIAERDGAGIYRLRCRSNDRNVEEIACDIAEAGCC